MDDIEKRRQEAEISKVEAETQKLRAELPLLKEQRWFSLRSLLTIGITAVVSTFVVLQYFGQIFSRQSESDRLQREALQARYTSETEELSLKYVKLQRSYDNLEVKLALEEEKSKAKLANLPSNAPPAEVQELERKVKDLTRERAEILKQRTALTTQLGVRKVSYFYSYSGDRGEQSIEPGKHYTIYNKPGGCGLNDLGQCEVTAIGEVFAFNRDSCDPVGITGVPVRSGCSRAQYKNFLVECCVLE